MTDISGMTEPPYCGVECSGVHSNIICVSLLIRDWYLASETTLFYWWVSDIGGPVKSGTRNTSSTAAADGKKKTYDVSVALRP